MVPDNLKNNLYWPQTENQTSNFVEMATIMGEKSAQVLPSTAYFKRKETGS